MRPTLYALKDGITQRVFTSLDDGAYLVGTGGTADLVVDPGGCREELLCQLEIGGGAAVVTETGEAEIRVAGQDPGFRAELVNGRSVSVGEWVLLAVWPPPEAEGGARRISELPPTAGVDAIAPASKELALKVYKGRRFQIVRAVDGLTFGLDRANHFYWDDFPWLSRFHAQIVDTVEGLQVEDRKSTHGTFVNGVELRGARAVLRPGAVITFTDLPSAPRVDVLSARQAKDDRLREDPRHAIIGEDEQLLHTLEVAAQLARGKAVIPIDAERGTGKEGLARFIASEARPGKPFVTVDCGSLPPTLFHAELFGAVKGAYTDGKLARTGLFRKANGGVIFLDEVGKMPRPVQASLLTFLQDRKVRPLGTEDAEEVDVVVITATNVDLFALAGQGEFLPDLADRIGTPQLRLPPLRERRGDLRAIAEFHVRVRADLPRRPPLSEEAVAVLLAQDWPGNIRQLCTVVEIAALRTRDGPITAEMVRAVLQGARDGQAAPAAKADTPAVRLAPVEAEALERQICLEAKEKTGLGWKKLWKDLGYTSDQQLYRRLKKWEIT